MLGHDMAVPQAVPIRSPQDGALAASAVFLKKPISAFYDGYPRLLYPHVLGWNKDRELRLLCFQFGGKSSRPLNTGEGSNWRCLRVNKLGAVKLLEQAWQSSGDHTRPQSCIQDIIFDAEDPEGLRQTKRRVDS